MRLGICVASVAAVCLASCEPVAVSTSDTPLEATASAASSVIFDGQMASLNVDVAGGTEPYFIRWNVNDAPTDVDLADPTTESTATSVLTELGRYTFRALVTDSSGQSVSDFVVVEVTSAVTASVPRLIIVGEASELSLETTADGLDVETNWEVTEGDADIEDPMATTSTIIANDATTLEITLTTTLDPDADSPIQSMETFSVVAASSPSPRVEVETSLGNFTIELEGEAAPIHTANFLQYVDEGFYDGLVIHRVACTNNEDTGECDPFVIQGGGYERIDDELVLREPTRDPIESESDNGLSNGDPLTVSLALSGAADTGQSQFFVNLRDNSGLDDVFFTVFGRVVEGEDVINTISDVETETSSIITNEDSQPVEDVDIVRIIRVDE